MSKHTPGPWQHQLCGNITAPNEKLGLRTICVSAHGANARLIVAAPRMLEALRMAEKHFDEAIHGRRPSVPPMEYCKRLRAAIAEATGGDK